MSAGAGKVALEPCLVPLASIVAGWLYQAHSLCVGGVGVDGPGAQCGMVWWAVGSTGASVSGTCLPRMGYLSASCVSL